MKKTTVAKNQLLEGILTILKDRRLWGFVAVVLIFFGLFVKTDFATDTYAELIRPTTDITTNLLESGRFVTAACFLLCKILHIGLPVALFASFVIAIGSLTLALYLLDKIVQRNLIKNGNWAFVVTILLLLNPFSIELMMFAEKGVMMFAILASVLSVQCFAKMLNGERTAKQISGAVIWSIIAACCYQGVVGIIILLATLLVVVKSKKWSDFWRNTLMSVGIYAVGPVVDLVLVRILMSGGRANGQIIITETLDKIGCGIPEILSMFNIIPGMVFWMLIGGIMVVMACWLFKGSSKKDENKTRVSHKLSEAGIMVLAVLYLGVVAFLTAIAPQIVQNSSSIWAAPRSAYAFASLGGVILAFILVKYPAVNRDKVRNLCLGLFVALFLGIQWMNFMVIEADHYSMQELDRRRAEQIGEIIHKYEEKHGIEVKKVMVAQDAASAKGYPGTKVIKDINNSSFGTPWSDVNGINYWNGRDFERVEADKEWQDYCAKQDWQYFEREQLDFESETMKMCLY